MRCIRILRFAQVGYGLIKKVHAKVLFQSQAEPEHRELPLHEIQIL